MKLITVLILSFILGISAYADTCNSDYKDVGNIVHAMGWRITSEMGGGHNAHSRHYVGKAIDISIRGKTEFDIAVLYTVLEPMGYIIRDERKRPLHQKVWGGSHFHIGVPLCN